ncbi:MAG: lipopolysaccharide kinase InaA family protein [Thermoanaerobaculia bacterium]
MTPDLPPPTLETPDWRVWLAPEVELTEVEVALRRITEPASGETLHWGRNYLYRTELPTAAAPLAVVVKQFRNHGRRARRRKRRGASKAARSWRAAAWLAEAGIATPARVAWLESRRPAGPSLYVSRYLPDRLEARALIRAMNADRAAEEAPAVSPEAFLTALGALARRLHDAGIVYRDLSVGNVLIRPGVRPEAPPELALVDCNRARRLPAHQRPGRWRRMRDLSRLNLRRPEHRRRLLIGYFGDPPPRVDRWLQILFQRAFEGKQSLKARLHLPLRWLKKLRPRGAHGHIPPLPAGAGSRDKAVWDALSDQPHQHASRLERLRVRLADSQEHARDAAAVMSVLPRAWARYRSLARDSPSPSAWEGPGVAVRPWPEDPQGLLDALEALGSHRVLLRLHPWQAEHVAEEALARELSARGFDLTFALPQSRELVLDPVRWRAAVEELGERFVPHGRRFQIGQAVNRSKWGVWNSREFAELAAAAAEVLRRHQGVELLGPGIIDFEPHALAALLGRPGCPRFDVVACLLYVDRRGAPENRQLGFDAAGKARLLRAIGETAAAGSPRFQITEVNWPLWEGPHSPAGRDVAVDEDTQASFLVRFMLEVAATGVVERVYWWQAVAKGYGLIDPGSGGLRRRPAFRAFARLEAELGSLRCAGPLPAPDGTRLYAFRGPAGRRVVGWSLDRPREIELPAPAVAGRERDGETLGDLRGRRVRVLPAPRYFDVESESL